MAQPFDTRRLEMTGEAVPVAEDVANPRDYRLGHFSVSQYGDLACELGGQDREQVAWHEPSWATNLGPCEILAPLEAGAKAESSLTNHFNPMGGEKHPGRKTGRLRFQCRLDSRPLA